MERQNISGQLRDLLSQEVKHFENFITHLKLVLSQLTDDNQKAIFGHILEKEEAHVDSIKQLIGSVIPPASVMGTPTPMENQTPSAMGVAEPVAEGGRPAHYRRRDVRELAVGNLMGRE